MLFFQGPGQLRVEGEDIVIFLVAAAAQADRRLAGKGALQVGDNQGLALQQFLEPWKKVIVPLRLGHGSDVAVEHQISQKQEAQVFLGALEVIPGQVTG